MASDFDDPDYDYAASIAGRAVRSMAEQRIPPTPTNFAIWYQYYAGSHNDLRNAIDLLIDHNRPFDSRTNQDLFETYIAPQVSAVVVETSERLQALMGTAKEFLATAIADNHSQMQAIGQVADQGKAGVDPKALVAQLMNELARAATRATRLEAGFEEKTRELDVRRKTSSIAPRPRARRWPQSSCPTDFSRSLARRARRRCCGRDVWRRRAQRRQLRSDPQDARSRSDGSPQRRLKQ